jgi:hypothetical protein
MARRTQLGEFSVAAVECVRRQIAEAPKLQPRTPADLSTDRELPATELSEFHALLARLVEQADWDQKDIVLARWLAIYERGPRHALECLRDIPALRASKR